SIADDIIGADAQRLPLAKAAESPQDRRILEGGIDLRLQLFLHLLLARAAPQRYTEHVEVIGIRDQEITKELAGAQQLEKDFQAAGSTFQQCGQRIPADRVGKKALQVVEGHIGIGTARQ